MVGVADHTAPPLRSLARARGIPESTPGLVIARVHVIVLRFNGFSIVVFALVCTGISVLKQSGLHLLGRVLGLGRECNSCRRHANLISINTPPPQAFASSV